MYLVLSSWDLEQQLHLLVVSTSQAVPLRGPRVACNSTQALRPRLGTCTLELASQWTPLAQLLLPLGLPKAPPAVRWSYMQVTLPQWVVLLPFEVVLVLRKVVTSR
jgi:hypothetical protein